MKSSINRFLSKNFNFKNSEQAYTMVRVIDINVLNEIANVFKIQPDIVEKITCSMKEKGFDFSQPLVIGKIKDIGEYLLDGHTRKKAAEQAGIEKVPVKYINCDSLEEAMQYTIKRQAERRNLTDGELLLAVELMPQKSIRDGSGRSAEKLGKEFGVSSSTVTHARTVVIKASKEDIEDIKKGDKSIQEVYQKVKIPKTKKQINEQGAKINTPSDLDNKESIIINRNEESNIITTNDNSIVSAEEIIRLLVENKELNAVNIILSKYRNSVSSLLLSELGL